MYQPEAHREEHLDRLHGLMRACPLALLVTDGPDGLTADPLPFLLDPARGPFGTLRAHLARANPHWRLLDGERESLVVFQGAQAYVSPSWYASKKEHGKVVPTWNYLIVQVRGRARVIDDTSWLRGQVSQLTASMEQDRPEPWAVGDAPGPFIAMQLKAIVGIEIDIARIEGKWKASQNRSPADRAGVMAALSGMGEPMALAMAETIGRR